MLINWDTILNKTHAVLPAPLKGQWRLQKNKGAFVI